MTQVKTQVTPSTVIDARGPRFSAAITSAVLATALATNNLWVVIAQAIVFAIGAFRGPQFTPYALLFKKIVKPRLNSAVVTEDVRPPQFAQSVGLIFALVAITGSITGISGLFVVAVSFALAAAFLNAAFNYCLGCEMYVVLLRLRKPQAS
jgi:hypothetical protein